MNNNFFKVVLKVIKYRLNLDEDKAHEDEVIERISKGIEFKGTNLWTLVFAIFIASIGLNVNSTAVIIGAMLISPLMGPIMGVGLGAGIFDFKLIGKAAKNLLISTLIGLVVSSIYFAISPLNSAQSELLARTSPTIWDVLIAFFGGLAGIVASSRRKYNSIIPGVAIATALMPPLCTAGFGIATGQWYYFFGAIYLYLINSVFISIATFLIVRFLKYKPVTYVDPTTSTRVKRWVVTIAILTIIPSLFLAYVFVKNEIFTQNASKFISEETSSANYTIISKRINPKNREISLTIIGTGKSDSIRQLLEIRKEKHRLEDAKIVIKNTIDEYASAHNAINSKESVIEEMFAKQELIIKNKGEELHELKKEIADQRNFNLKRDNAMQEFNVLFGATKELIIEKSISQIQGKNDTTLIVIIKTNAKIKDKNNTDKIRKWLSVKFEINSVKIIYE